MPKNKRSTRKQIKTIVENLRLAFVYGWGAASEYYGKEYGFRVVPNDTPEMEAQVKAFVLDPKKNGSPLKSMDGFFNRTFEKYRRALLDYGKHNDGCKWWDGGSQNDECTCGWKEIETALKQGNEIG